MSRRLVTARFFVIVMPQHFFGQIPSDPQEAREQALNRLRDVQPAKRKRTLVVQKVTHHNTAIVGYFNHFIIVMYIYNI